MALKLTKKIDILTEITFTEGEATAKFRFKEITPEDMQAIVKRSTVHTWDSPDKRTAKQRFENFDHVLFHKETFIEGLREWDGVTDEDENALACNRENKADFYKNMPKVVEYLKDELEAIKNAKEAAKEGEEKN